VSNGSVKEVIEVESHPLIQEKDFKDETLNAEKKYW